MARNTRRAASRLGRGAITCTILRLICTRPAKKNSSEPTNGMNSPIAGVTKPTMLTGTVELGHVDPGAGASAAARSIPSRSMKEEMVCSLAGRSASNALLHQLADLGRPVDPVGEQGGPAPPAMP